MITDSCIAIGDQLGAQMLTYANLLYIGHKNGQRLVFWEELKDFRRGYQFFDVFDIPKERLLKSNSFHRFISRLYLDVLCQKRRNVDWKKEFKSIYRSKWRWLWDQIYLRCVQLAHFRWKRFARLKNGVHTAKELLNLNRKGYYDIQAGFGTYMDWREVEDEVRREFRFNESVVKKGDEVWDSLCLPSHREYVGVHFRRTDYLLISSLCLSENYYQEAFSHFDPENHCLLVFSDDVDGCKNLELWGGGGFDVVFMPQNSAPVDMYLMTKCDHNIIANSTFSFWGAFLNRNRDKKVICPEKFIGDSSPENMYINGHWYPKEWIAIDMV